MQVTRTGSSYSVTIVDLPIVRLRSLSDLAVRPVPRSVL